MTSGSGAGPPAMSRREADDSYSRFYDQRDPLHVYPVEFVVRAFLGKYPRLAQDPSTYPGSRVLDLGFGDGRNMPLLRNLGFKVHGVEITEEICELTERRMERAGVRVELRVGRNAAIPYADDYFGYVVSSHACYYVDEGTTFDDNVSEIRRVLEPNGVFVFSAPRTDTYILDGAEDLGDGHFRITHDPYGVRAGTIFRAFETPEDLRAAMSHAFGDFHIGHCNNDFWGIEERVWIVVCTAT